LELSEKPPDKSKLLSEDGGSGHSPPAEKTPAGGESPAKRQKGVYRVQFFAHYPFPLGRLYPTPTPREGFSAQNPLPWEQTQSKNKDEEKKRSLLKTPKPDLGWLGKESQESCRVRDKKSPELCGS